MDANGFDRFCFHVQIPDLEGQIVAGKDVSSVATEFDVRNRGDDFRKERFRTGIFFLFKHFCRRIAKCSAPHVAKFDASLATTVHEQITVLRMEFGRSDDFG